MSHQMKWLTGSRALDDQSEAVGHGNLRGRAGRAGLLAGGSRTRRDDFRVLVHHHGGTAAGGAARGDLRGR